MVPRRSTLVLRNVRVHGFSLLLIIIGAIIAGFSFCNILTLSISATYNPTISYSGLDILHDCSANFTAFVGLVPIADSHDILVSVSMRNMSQFFGNLSVMEIHFPGFTHDHKYLIDLADLMPENVSIDQFLLWLEASKRPLLPKMELIRDFALTQDIMIIRPQEIENFTGLIQFVWMDSLRRVNFERVGFILPFQSPSQLLEAKLNRIMKYDLQLWFPLSYELAAASPQPSRLKILGEKALYVFEIELYGKDFYVSFENKELASQKQLNLTIYSAFFGIGSTVSIRETIDLARRIGSIKRKRKRS